MHAGFIEVFARRDSQMPASNPRGKAIIVTKQASGTAKIDPLIAVFNAVAWMTSNPAFIQPSIFWLWSTRHSNLLDRPAGQA